jgi:hypothetical protein
MATYTVVSDRLSRKRGETFTSDELPEASIASLVAGGHLQETVPTAPAKSATDKKGAV